MSDFARPVNSATLADINRANAAFHGQTADQVPGAMATRHQQAVEKQKHIPGSYESGAKSGEHALNRVRKSFRRFEKQHGRKPDHGEAQALLHIEGQKDDDHAISMTQAAPTFGEGAKKLVEKGKAAQAAKVATKAAHFGRAALAEQRGHKTRLALSGKDAEENRPTTVLNMRAAQATEYKKRMAQWKQRATLSRPQRGESSGSGPIYPPKKSKDVRHPEGPQGKTQQTRGGQVVVQHDEFKKASKSALARHMNLHAINKGGTATEWHPKGIANAPKGELEAIQAGKKKPYLPKKTEQSIKHMSDDHFPATDKSIADVNDANKQYYNSSRHAGMAQDERKPGVGWHHHSTHGENRPYHLLEGAGTEGGSWAAREVHAGGNKPREMKIFRGKGARQQAMEHIHASQD